MTIFIATLVPHSASLEGRRSVRSSALYLHAVKIPTIDRSDWRPAVGERLRKLFAVKGSINGIALWLWRGRGRRTYRVAMPRSPGVNHPRDDTWYQLLYTHRWVPFSHQNNQDEYRYSSNGVHFLTYYSNLPQICLFPAVKTRLTVTKLVSTSLRVYRPHAATYIFPLRWE